MLDTVFGGKPKCRVSHCSHSTDGNVLDLAVFNLDCVLDLCATLYFPCALQPRSRRRSKSRTTTDRLVFLTVEQKCDLAQRELEETREDKLRMKENSERLLQNYLV